MAKTSIFSAGWLTFCPLCDTITNDSRAKIARASRTRPNVAAIVSTICGGVDSSKHGKTSAKIAFCSSVRLSGGVFDSGSFFVLVRFFSRRKTNLDGERAGSLCDRAIAHDGRTYLTWKMLNIPNIKLS